MHDNENYDQDCQLPLSIGELGWIKMQQRIEKKKNKQKKKVNQKRLKYHKFVNF